MPKLGKRLRRKLLHLGLLLIVLSIGYYLNRTPRLSQPLVKIVGGNYQVIEFVDGDTIIVNMNGSAETIRLVGVDTPETKDPRTTVQCFGQAASNFTRQLIGNQPLRFEADALSTNRDRYDRLLRYVYLPDNRLVNAEIIKEGYGFAYLSFPFTKSDEFHNYEVQAREAGKGLWGSCSTVQNGQRIQTQ